MTRKPCNAVNDGQRKEFRKGKEAGVKKVERTDNKDNLVDNNAKDTFFLDSERIFGQSQKSSSGELAQLAQGTGK